jgi:hypothetical protein
VRQTTGRLNRLGSGRGALVALLTAGAAFGCALAAPLRAQACANAQYRAGPGEHLPDCRAYEQVSPPEKNGANAYVAGYPAQASAQGGAIAYLNYGLPGAPNGAQLPAYLSVRGSGGWETQVLSPATPDVRVHEDKLSYDFSEDLSWMVVNVALEKLTPEAPEGVYNLFRRAADGSYSLVSAAEPSEPTPAGCDSCFQSKDVPAFAGASRDFSDILFEVNESLLTGESELAPKGVGNLYESTLEGADGESVPAAERVHAVGVLPDGKLASGGSEPGAGLSSLAPEEADGDVEHAISEDGSRVLFQAHAEGAPDAAQAGLVELYDRIDGSSTVELSAPAAGAQATHCETVSKNCQPEAAQFWGASADGSTVFFTSKAALTKEANTGKQVSGKENPGDDLYAYTFAPGTDSGTLSDLTADPTDPDGANVQGVAGISEDGAYVYFVAQGVLSGANVDGNAPVAGKDNLYAWHEGERRFIATLKEPQLEEEEEETAVTKVGDSRDWTAHPVEMQAYVTPDGTHLAFMSRNPLTGYGNEDERTGEAADEVFEYGYESGQLVCASCDPDGARPLGSAFIDAATAESEDPATAFAKSTTLFHQPRVLSDDGSRLFFSSPDPLVPEASSPQAQVYEYENGEPHLISSGASATPDVFVDASASGDDVLFATSERLAPTDRDELVDLYDARVEGGFPPPPPPASPPCAGNECQPPLAAPSFAAPSSASLAGVGNLAPPPPAPKPKPLTRAELLAKALKACAREPKRKRGACVTRARSKYGSKSHSAKAHHAKAHHASQVRS